MKKILYLNVLLAVLFCSCDPMEDIYDKIDEESPVLNVQQLDYTLTDDDYEAIGGDVAEYSNFSSSVAPSDYLPDYFADKYATLDEGSIINVTYNYYTSAVLEKDYAYEIASNISNEYQLMGQSYNNFSDEEVAEASIVKLINSYGEYAIKEAGDELTVKYILYAKGVTRYIKVNEDWSTEILDDKPKDFYELDSADYKLLGEDKYYNFSYIDDAESGVSSFAQMTEGKGAGNYACKVNTNYIDSYVLLSFDGSSWSVYETTTAKTEQYMFSDNIWKFDPTVVYSMKAIDYQTIVDYVESDIDASYLDSYKTSESYYGSNAYYIEFNILDGSFDKTFRTWEEAVSAGIQDGFLPSKFPEAISQVNERDVYYVISFDAYKNSMVPYSMKFQCVKSSPSPEFTYVESSLTAE